jgi:hypothetical protein
MKRVKSSFLVFVFFITFRPKTTKVGYTYNKASPNFFRKQKKKSFPQRKRSLLNVKKHFSLSLPSTPFCLDWFFIPLVSPVLYISLRVVRGRYTRPFSAARPADWADWQLSVMGYSLIASRVFFFFILPSSRGWENLWGLGTSTATDGTTGTATSPLAAEATTATTTAVEVAAATAVTALLEAATAALETLLLAVVGTDVAALLDPEFLLADLEGAGSDGGLVALGGLEVDESAVLFVESVKLVLW